MMNDPNKNKAQSNITSADTTSGGLTYRQAGVDIDAGDALVQAIKPLAAATRRPGADASLGGFGALFDLKAAGYHDPILVSSTDGVGTKVKLAVETGLHDGIGIDLVAMCVNDILVQGAEPLFFLDYYASGKLDVPTARAVVAGIAHGCRLAGCALIGGETAEMPGHYVGSDYDLAGFTVGAAERGRLLPRADLVAGDCVIGLASSGAHANGYSLIRRILADGDFDCAKAAPFDPTQTLGQILMTPTRIYVESLMPLVKTDRIKAMAHITGGGLIENIPRVLPAGLMARLDAKAMPLPPLFEWLMRAGRVAPLEMARTFNCGIGLVLIVAENQQAEILDALRAAGEAPRVIGRLTKDAGGADAPRTVIDHIDSVWTAST